MIDVLKDDNKDDDKDDDNRAETGAMNKNV